MQLRRGLIPLIKLYGFGTLQPAVVGVQMTPFNGRLLSLFMISKYAARLHDVIVKLQEACDAFKDLPLDQKKALNSHQELEQWVDFLVEARDLCAELKLVSSQARHSTFHA